VSIQLFGVVSDQVRAEIDGMIGGIVNTVVFRKDAARSSNPFPASTDLEEAIKPWMQSNGFVHHPRFTHPLTGKGFEYDFFNEKLRIAVEVMGYRADDEVYKDILKFHVHTETRVGVVLVPRWKWLGLKKTSTNFDAAIKALSFANTFMDVNALVSIAYDWQGDGDGWRLMFVS
jgi:hypothetical protein